ncbi:nucleoside deaminase [Nonomuraea sp. NPDC047897]|uniref:nucleoside deaminase n=1 Tax=Nonomuraea sp. NPDC047897 TaxID=3364346 RepID=UPI00371C64C9
MSAADLRAVMDLAVEACIAHVAAGGLPFVGVLVEDTGKVISQFGVNRVRETGDPTAHAEVVAMRDAMTTHGLDTLTGTVLLATGEPCGLCYRYAIDRGVEAIYVAVDRDEVAAFGFDYRAGYPAFGITDEHRAELLRPLPVARGDEPFTHYLNTTIAVRNAPARPDTESRGTPS